MLKYINLMNYTTVCGNCLKFMPSLFVRFSFCQQFVELEEVLDICDAEFQTC